MKKTFEILGIALLVLIVIVSIVAGFYIGPIVKIGMEQIGPKVAQVTVKVDAVDVMLLTGSTTIKGLVVGNPSGYTTPEAINVGTITVSLDPLSVMTKKILVHEVRVVSPEITFDGGLTSNNLNKILDNVNTFSRSSAPAASNNPASKIEVDDFLITGAKVHVNIRGLFNKEIPLPDIHLTDLGKGNNGLTPAELASAVLRTIIPGIISAVTSSVGSISNTLGGGISQVTGALGGLFGK